MPTARSQPRRSPAARARAAAGRAVLRIERATKRFGALAAVNEVSFEVRPGEVLGLIGPNGAGKTTLLNLITGTAKPNAGQIVFLGDDITSIGAAPHRRQGHGADVPARQAAPEHDAARQRRCSAPIRARARVSSRARFGFDRAEERSARVEALQQLQRVGLGEKFGDLAGNLPLGQQRLLEVARALAADPVRA